MKKEKTMLAQIIEHCAKNGITSYELAKHIDLSQVALHGILTGTTTRPRIKNVKMIYDYLFKDSENNLIKEEGIIYETPLDNKINIAANRIKELEDKLKKNDPPISENTILTIKKIIEQLYDEIAILQEAKNDKLKSDFEKK